MDGIRVMGPLELVVGGKARRVGGPRRRALLSVLTLMPNGVVSNDRLLDFVWGPDGQEGSLRSLRSEVSRLRADVDGIASVVGENGGYRLEIDESLLDSTRFEALLESAAGTDEPLAAVERLDEALALWRGEPYGEIADRTEVASAARHRLHEARLAALVRRAEIRLELAGDSTDRLGVVVAELRGLVEQHRLQERLWALLMMALYRTGRQADALAAYQELRHTLVEELGAEPTAEAADLERRILIHDPSLRTGLDPGPKVLASRLPRPIKMLIGRLDELETLGRLVDRDAHAVVTLVGFGGVGKTHLAVEVARRWADSGDGQAIFVDLSVVRQPALVIGAVLDGFGLQSDAGQPPLDRLKSWIGDRPTLLVLDNCEHLVGAAAEVAAELSNACPKLTVLSTSREPLGVSGEVTYRLSGLPSDHPASTAVQLFVQRGRSVDHGFEPNADDLETIRDVCRVADGLPLAIELAAATVRTLDVTEIAEQLSGWRDLTVAARDVPERHRTLRAVVDWSVGLLADEEAELLRQLGVFVGGCRLGAACRVVGWDESDLIRTLDSLIAKSLVVRDRDGDRSSRYRLAEPVRDWAQEQLVASNELGELRTRHAVAYRSELAAWSIWSYSTPRFFRRFHPDSPNLVAATEWWSSTDPRAAMDVLAPAVEVFVAGGRGEWCLAAIEQCLASTAVDIDHRFLGLTRLLLGSMLMLDRQRIARVSKLLDDEPDPGGENSVYLGASRAIAAVTSDPHGSAEVIEAVRARRQDVGDVEAFDRHCMALEVNRLALIGHEGEAVECFVANATGQDLGGLWVSSAAGAALVSAYVVGEPQLRDVIAVVAGVEDSTPLFDGGLAAMRVLTGPGPISERREQLRAMAATRKYEAFSRFESVYLVCLGRLAFEEGDEDRARQLLDTASMRSAAITTLIRTTMASMDRVAPEVARSREYYQSLFAHRRTPEWEQRANAKRALEAELSRT